MYLLGLRIGTKETKCQLVHREISVYAEVKYRKKEVDLVGKQRAKGLPA